MVHHKGRNAWGNFHKRNQEGNEILIAKFERHYFYYSLNFSLSCLCRNCVFIVSKISHHWWGERFIRSTCLNGWWATYHNFPIQSKEPPSSPPKCNWNSPLWLWLATLTIFEVLDIVWHRWCGAHFIFLDLNLAASEPPTNSHIIYFDYFKSVYLASIFSVIILPVRSTCWL